jgi:ABC-type Mn2+/Zn2+ transport system ATPase subunit
VNSSKWLSSMHYIFHTVACLHNILDETMAPLDPKSKSQVMSKLKEFCSNSVVLVIYHTDVGRGKELKDAESFELEECVASNGFFDHNLHVSNKHMMHRPVC